MGKVNLKRPLNKREKIMFAVAFVVYCLGFTNSCVFMFNSAINDANKKYYDLVKERDELLSFDAPKKVEEPPLPFELGDVSSLNDAPVGITQPTQLNGIAIDKITFSKVTKEDAILSRSTHLSFVGEYYDIIRYIEYLEIMKPRVIIDSIVLKKHGNDDSKVMVQIDGVMYAFN